MKRFAMTLVLASFLSSAAVAGEIPSVGAPAPPPSGGTQTTISTEPGNIPSDGLAGQISDAALSALLSVFGLLG
jgi:hypothetical protein